MNSWLWARSVTRARNLMLNIKVGRRGFDSRPGGVRRGRGLWRGCHRGLEMLVHVQRSSACEEFLAVWKSAASGLKLKASISLSNLPNSYQLIDGVESVFCGATDILRRWLTRLPYTTLVGIHEHSSRAHIMIMNRFNDGHPPHHEMSWLFNTNYHQDWVGQHPPNEGTYIAYSFTGVNRQRYLTLSCSDNIGQYQTMLVKDCYTIIDG